jgi:hypothetical protein
MVAGMKTAALLPLVLLTGSPAIAGASNFVLVNGTGADLSRLSIRRSGTAEWKELGNAPASGARGPVTFKDPDCAFDLKANIPGSGPITWTDVNLCDVKSVTLKRDRSAGAWVDYDQ